MGRKRKAVQRGKTDLQETLAHLLREAVARQDDFILTYETEEEEDPGIQVFSGKLITPCMRGTLRNRARLQEEEGSSFRVFPA